MAVCVWTFTLIIGLMLAYRGYSSVATYVATNMASFVIMLLGAAATLASGVLAVVRERKHADELRYKIFTMRHMFIAVAILTVCAFSSWYYSLTGVKAMYAFVPIIAALILVYLLYPTDFFYIADVSACAAAVLWYLSVATGDGFVWIRGVQAGKPLYFTVLAVILLVAYAFIAYNLRSKKGTLKLRGVERQLFPRAARYRLTYLTAGLALLCILAGFLFGSTVAFYAMFIMLAWLFALVVYYTVKLM